MNIKELASQVWGDDSGKPWSDSALGHLEKFAELILEQERKEAAEHYLKMIRDCVATEREQCAQVCEKQIKSYMSKRYTTDPLGGYRERFAAEQCAAAIRARGDNHD